MRCENCEYFKVMYAPQIICGECWDFGKAECRKHNLEVDFRNYGKIRRLTCIEDRDEKKRKISEEVEFYENRDRKKVIIAKREVPRLSKAFLGPIYQYTKLEGGDHTKNRRHD